MDIKATFQTTDGKSVEIVKATVKQFVPVVGADGDITTSTETQIVISDGTDEGVKTTYSVPMNINDVFAAFRNPDEVQ